MNFKRFLLSVTALILTVAVAGCGLVRVNEEKNNKIVIAEVNGEKILKGAFLKEWERARLRYGGNIPKEDEDKVKENILEGLIQQELILQKAKAAGFEVTDEVMEEARRDYENEIESYARELQAEARAREEEEKNKEQEEGTEEDVTETDEPIEQKYLDQAKVEIKEWLEMMKLTEEEYIEITAREKVMDAFMKDQTRDVEVEDKEIRDLYDKTLKDQRENPSYLAYGQSYFPVIVLKTPESRTVKHILIKIPDEAMTEITNLRKENKDDDADKLLEEKLAEIEQKANEVLAKARTGEDFEKLIETYGEDPGMKDEAYKDGYVVYRDGSFVKPFEDMAYELEEGEISDLVPSDNGYHIIKLYKATEEEVIPFEDVSDEIEETLKTQKQSEKWYEIVEGWLEKATIKRYKKRLK